MAQGIKHLKIIVCDILLTIHQLESLAPRRHRQHLYLKAGAVLTGRRQRLQKGRFGRHDQPIAGNPDFAGAPGQNTFQQLVFMKLQILNTKAFQRIDKFVIFGFPLF